MGAPTLMHGHPLWVPQLTPMHRSSPHTPSFLLLLSLFCLLLPSAAAQDWGVFFKDEELTEVVLPFEMKSHLILIPVRINGGPPMKFIFDTGAENIVLLEKAFLPFLGMTVTREIKVLGADMLKDLRAYLSPNVDLSIGPLEARRQNLVVLERNTLQLERLLGEEVHGILGASLFRMFVIHIDYRRRQLRLKRKASFKPPGGRYRELPISVMRQRPFLEAAMVTPQGDTLRDLRFLIDTGAGLTALVSAHTHSDLEVPKTSILTSVGAGLGGQVSGFVSRVPRLEIGPFAFQDMVTSFQDIPDSLQWPVSVSRNGLIGNELLSRFDVWLDYVDERLYVRPVRKWQEAFRYDRSGLVLVAGGENLREMVISHIVEGSPAAHAGLQRGDRLVSVNGVPARWRSMASVAKVLRKRIGKRIKLVVERNGQRLRTEFRLEKLI